MVVVVFSALANAFRSFIFHGMSERVARNLRDDFYTSIVNKDIAFFDERKSGDLLSRLNSDIQVIQEALTVNVSQVLKSVLFIVCVMAIMLYISAPLTGVTFAAIVPIILLAIFFGKKMRII